MQTNGCCRLETNDDPLLATGRTEKQSCEVQQRNRGDPENVVMILVANAGWDFPNLHRAESISTACRGPASRAMDPRRHELSRYA